MSDELRRALMTKRPTVRRRRPGARRTFHIALPQTRLTLVGGVKRRPTGRVRPARQPIAVRLAPGPRLLSLALLALIVAIMAALFTRDDFYVTRPVITGLKTIPVEQVLPTVPVDGLHIFWLDGRALESAVKAIPGVADAHVTVRLPNLVEIQITERMPVLSWRQAGAVTWIDSSGLPMPARNSAPDLLTVTAENATGPLTSGAPLPQDIIVGALALKGLKPEIRALHYSAHGGLAWDDPRGWQVSFGTGPDMAQRMMIYDALVNNLKGRGIRPQYVAVDDVEHPYYKVSE